jgi:anaerobic selenocysteine-containing dehydrogenase
MKSTAFGTCPLCEAICGIAVEIEDNKILRIRGDAEDPFSHGYICPKAVALQDIQHDPDRLQKPLRRSPNGGGWTEVTWAEALDEAGDKIGEIQERHGRDAVGVYVGNPTGHSYSAVLYGILLNLVLDTKRVFTANSVDALPRLLTSLHLFGAQTLLPIPDLDRTDFLLILGANPAVSNGSVMTAPDAGRRVKAIRERGGRVIVVDPRRTETADIADQHIFLRPASDAFLLLGMLHTIFTEQLGSPGKLEAFVDGMGALRTLTSPFPPERVAGITGVPASAIRSLARDFAKARSAVCYGRMGTCTQEFGAVTTWLIDALNIVTGNLDRPGGSMFTTPAFDLVATASVLGQSGAFGRWKSRVSGLPEFNGELPSATLAEEIETPGEGQVRALITHAGNPVLSLANGTRLARAFEKLDFMVSIDIYRNETTGLANLILPPTFGLEHDHYPLLFHSLAVRNTAKYSLPLLTPAPGQLHDWQILAGISARVLKRRGGAMGLAAGPMGMLTDRVRPEHILAAALRIGPYGNGIRPFGDGLSLEKLKGMPHGKDLGPLEPRLPERLETKNKRIDLAPEAYVKDVPRLEGRLREFEAGKANGNSNTTTNGNANTNINTTLKTTTKDSLMLIGRRHLRSNNSWMHNAERLVKGRNRCTLLIHPDDAGPLEVRSGDRVRITSRVGSVEAEAEVTDTILQGVVSLPHGWGHDRPGSQLRVASEHAGVSLNDLTDDALVDRLSGCTHLNGIPVKVERPTEAAS